tara:strand:- start:414 stop:653 length:240 start_codon:yes stop_codon:yes gene_type:complete
MKKIYKTFNYLINYLFQVIQTNFLLLISYLNKKNYSNIFGLKEKYLFIKENFFYLKELKKNLYLKIYLIVLKIILINKI